MKKISAILVLSTIAAALYAQNGNHTVEVTNEYVSQLSGLQKTGVEMAVPDSLLHFDYKFDYSVFETPYKGAYEFSPYHIHVQPQASLYDAGKLYLRAGAGFTIHPVLEFAAAAVTKPGFALDIYNVGRGFYGRNAGNSLSAFGSGVFDGYDGSNRLGMDARWIRPKVEAKLGLSYDLIAVGDTQKILNQMTHSGGLVFSIAPLNVPEFYYAFDASGRFTTSKDYEGPSIKETYGKLGGTLGQGAGHASRFLIDFSLEADLFSTDVPVEDGKNYKNNLALFSATPSYNFNKGPFSIKLGAKVDYSNDLGFSVAPVALAKARFGKDKAAFYVGADGGQSIIDHFTMKSAYHRNSCSVADVNKEVFHAFAGLEGHAGHQFEWGLKAGYHNWKSKAFETFYGFSEAAASLLYVDGKFALKTERIDFDGNFRLARNKLYEAADVILAPSVSGDVRLMYNRNKRLFAGVWASGQTARKGYWLEQETSIPAWVNLGINAEYKVSTKWGIWLEAGNLLFQELWLTPVCAEKDPYATLGICLKF